ncbi:MAG TPA: glutathione S-transferase family protein [Polyangiaceae bacterium]|jgi:glutathione S-transferase|nr:glutathione S-transferase family protein [Polyangiaceae bacterium]
MTTTKTLELLYFPIRGRAEPARLLLAYVGRQYTDTAITMDRWPSLKPTLTFGQMPVLIEREGERETQIPQSMAIVRHLAREHDLYGANEAERTMCDVVTEKLVEWRNAFNQVAYFPRFAKDKEAIAKYMAESLPKERAIFDRLLTESAGRGSQFFVGSSLTFVDILVFDTADAHLQLEPASLDGAERLQSFVETMRALPGVKERIAQRGPTDFEVFAKR